jgi:hypothetical protein
MMSAILRFLGQKCTGTEPYVRSFVAHFLRSTPAMASI